MITILCIGKNKDRSLRDLEQEYVRRLQAFDRVEVTELKDEPTPGNDRPLEQTQAMDREAARALDRIRPEDYVILLDLHGTEWDSESFAARLADWRMRGRRLVFVIAGSLGPGAALTARADVRWKLSDLTFTHLMTRVLILEQIYRGFMITAGRPYHK